MHDGPRPADARLPTSRARRAWRGRGAPHPSPQAALGARAGRLSRGRRRSPAPDTIGPSCGSRTSGCACQPAGSPGQLRGGRLSGCMTRCRRRSAPHPRAAASKSAPWRPPCAARPGGRTASLRWRPGDGQSQAAQQSPSGRAARPAQRAESLTRTQCLLFGQLATQCALRRRHGARGWAQSGRYRA